MQFAQSMGLTLTPAGRVHDLMTKVSLKDMDSALLTQTFSGLINRLSGVNSVLVHDAITFSSYVHRNDMRSNRKGFNKTPYIEHPLRNAIRIARWGSKSEALFIGTLLHDTVEDHAKEMARDFCGVDTDDEGVAREHAFKYIGEQYGADVERIVRGMSNPLPDPNASAPLTVEEKDANYRQHVVDAIDDPDVFVSKFSDFTDNALGLYHNVAGMNPEGVRRRANKYLPLCAEFKKRLLDPNFPLPVSDEGRQEMLQALLNGEARLKSLSGPKAKV